MQFKTWYPATIGEKRIAEKFAFSPIVINNDFRWLETVTIEWEYQMVPTFLPPCLPNPKWVKIAFVDKKRMKSLSERVSEL